MYWARTAAYSGDLYHETEQGDAPVMAVESITENFVAVAIRPKTIIFSAPDIDRPVPYGRMAVKARNIDGTEIDITYGEPAPFPSLLTAITRRHLRPM